MKTASLSLALVIVAMLVADPARADDTIEPTSRAATVARLSDDGFALFKARDYRHAAEKFLAAYALDPDPNLLFNLARCYESMGDADAAIEKYEAFLAKPDADPKGRQRASEAIRALRQTKAGAPPSAKAAPAAPTTTAAVTADAAPASAVETGGARSANEPPSLKAPVILLGAGAAAIVAGVVAYELGARDHNRVTDSSGYGTPGAVDPLTEAQANALVQSGSRKKLIGVIGLGVGGALLATSAILFAARSSGESERTIAGVDFGPAPSGGGGQLMLRGRF
jgi:tetratricopeptide (TPR) repeat protein